MPSFLTGIWSKYSTQMSIARTSITSIPLICKTGLSFLDHLYFHWIELYPTFTSYGAPDYDHIWTNQTSCNLWCVRCNSTRFILSHVSWFQSEHINTKSLYFSTMRCIAACMHTDRTLWYIAHPDQIHFVFTFEMADMDILHYLYSPHLSDSGGPSIYASSHSLACLVFLAPCPLLLTSFLSFSCHR